MYFHSRVEAGQRLAIELTQYYNQKCCVLALNNGAVIIGEQIAAAIHCRLLMLLSEGITLPGERSEIGTIAQDGSFAYNNSLSAGEIDEYYSEFHGYIDDQKRVKFEEINRILGSQGAMDKNELQDHIVILVSDGLKSGASLEAAAQFLKPVRVARLVIATPIASVQAVDKMHIMADELHCLGVTENFISTNHYYDENNLPDQDEVLSKINHNY